MPGEGSRPPSVSGSIQLSALPASPERSSRLFGLAPVGSRRFTRSLTNVIAERIILGQSCVVSVPLPGLSPSHLRGPPSHGGGTFLSEGQALTVSCPPSPGTLTRRFLIFIFVHPIAINGLSREALKEVRIFVTTDSRITSCVVWI